jgi:3-hydroxyisobutyrate dehydrogenase
MRPSLRHLQVSKNFVLRSRSTAFIGLGRMGYQMAYNLFSKQYVQANAESFVVCDAVPEAARSFYEEFSRQYPDSQISIANTPEE